MADRRVIYPYSDFMFHNYSGGAFGKGGNLETKVKHSAKTIKAFFKEIKKLSSNLFAHSNSTDSN